MAVLKTTAAPPCIAVMGTGSDVGKSVIATALCRILADRGLRVAPFKAQNMSNNSGVTPEGLEMGRAQIVQAEAARIAPHVDMNPVLLKPTSEVGSQVVLLGEAFVNTTAAAYHQLKERLFKEACLAYDRLATAHELIVMEGAGSCAEVNLMASDITNLRMADYASARVLLVADIHRGGVFAQLVGTLACLAPAQQDQIAGFVINRFRGDIALFADGARWIQARTAKPVFGVLPWFTDISIEAEDSVVLENPPPLRGALRDRPLIGVIRLPHISNFTDFDPLRNLDGLALQFLEKVQGLSPFSAVILPGSKNTRFDLAWLHRSGWSDRLKTYAEAGGRLLGICGGYQILGQSVADPEGLEGPPGTTSGLGLLPVTTRLAAPKTTTRSRFRWGPAAGSGYEIHMGQTQRGGGSPLLTVTERNGRACSDEDGCLAPGGRVMGTYLHGLFDTPGVTRAWLAAIGLDGIAVTELQGLAARDRAYDRLAAHFTRFIDTDSLLSACLDLKRTGN
jgi:adenosylcobyric acid synthase